MQKIKFILMLLSFSLLQSMNKISEKDLPESTLRANKKNIVQCISLFYPHTSYPYKPHETSLIKEESFYNSFAGFINQSFLMSSTLKKEVINNYSAISGNEVYKFISITQPSFLEESNFSTQEVLYIYPDKACQEIYRTDKDSLQKNFFNYDHSPVKKIIMSIGEKIVCTKLIYYYS